MIHSGQIQPDSFELALDHLVDHELDLGDLDARFNNDQTGAPAYDPRAMLKIVLLGYSRGLISSRRIAQLRLEQPARPHDETYLFGTRNDPMRNGAKRGYCPASSEVLWSAGGLTPIKVYFLYHDFFRV